MEKLATTSANARVRTTPEISGEVLEEGDSNKREGAYDTSPSSSESAAPIAEEAAATEAEVQANEDEAVNNDKIGRAQTKEK